MKLKSTLVIIAIIAVGALVYAWFSSDGSRQSRQVLNAQEAQDTTLVGTYICLPHADTSGPQTMECAFGIETDDGENYAIDAQDLPPAAMAAIKTGDRIQVVGTLTPRSELASDNRLLQYDIEGVLDASSVSLQDTAPGQTAAPPDRHVAAGGQLVFERPHDFGLAVTQEQILVRSYIPPCAAGFDYCLYYNDTTYEGTNFESAGLRIQRRPDLTTETACLTTLPAGYSNLQPSIRRGDGYAVSTFSSIGDAAMGHYSEGSIYRLSFESACYEFETRIGMSQIANYEPGAIEEFTPEARAAMEAKLSELLASVRLVDREDEIIFPPAPAPR